MKSKFKNILILGASSLTMLTAFNNCSKQGLETIDAEAKQNLLSSTSVISESGGSSGSTTPQGAQQVCDPNIDDTCTMDDNKPPVTTSTLPAPQPQTQAPQQPAPPQYLPVHRKCTTKNGPGEERVVNAESLKLTINRHVMNDKSSKGAFGIPGADANYVKGEEVCADINTLALKQDLSKGYINLQRCLNKSGTNLSSDDRFSISLSSGQKNVSLGASGIMYVSQMVQYSAPDSYTTSQSSRAFSVYYADNPKLIDSNHALANESECDTTSSPLFVDLRDKYERTQKFSLLAPWNGVKFDIMGENAEPEAHEKMQISWFKRNSGFGFIALPNAQGEVLGVDQLFGDNTKGPDGKFAANGYAALAKYDDNKDGLITSSDAVFSKLRIFLDRDADGRSTARELLSMEEAGLTAIDLNYDASFAEKDVYGNDILYKSVAKTKDGNLKLVFDVWFETNMKKSIQRFQESLMKLGKK